MTRSGSTPSPQARSRASLWAMRRPSRNSGALGDPLDCPVSGGVRGDRAEQRRLLAQRAKVCERLASAGEHHREVAKDASRVMARAALAHRRQLSGERPREAGLVSYLGEQGGAGVGDQALSVRRDFYGDFAAIALHRQGDPPDRALRASAPAESRFRRTKPRPGQPGARFLHERSGLGTHTWRGMHDYRPASKFLRYRTPSRKL